MNAPHDTHAADAAALAPRRIARHRERLRRAGRGQCARPAGQGHRLVLHRPARFPDAARTSRTPAIAAIKAGKHGYTPSAGIDELRAAAAKDIGARRGLEVQPDDVVVGAGAKPFIAYTIASVTDYGAGDEVIYPVPGFPIYESQILANGAVPVPIYLREARDFAFDPAELEAKITPQTQAADPQHAAQSDRRHAAAPPISTRSPTILARHPQVWVFADEIYSRLAYAGAFDSLASAAGDAGAHDHLRRRVEDLGDDRLADRLRRQPHAGAGVHALDHQHRFVRVADLAVGGGRGDHRPAGRRRRDARELPRAPRPHRRPAQHGARHHAARRPAARSTRGRTSPRPAGSPAAPIPRRSASGC